jgi:hypothetical protein
VKKTQHFSRQQWAAQRPQSALSKFSAIAESTKAIQLRKINGTLVKQSRNLEEFFFGAPM